MHGLPLCQLYVKLLVNALSMFENLHAYEKGNEGKIKAFYARLHLWTVTAAKYISPSDYKLGLASGIISSPWLLELRHSNSSTSNA